jgi:hypothetical protein
LGEFLGGGRATEVVSGVGAEFVVAAPHVLDRRVTAYDDSGSPIAFEATHRSQAALGSLSSPIYVDRVCGA